ncbi:MAG: hypothetical protein ACREKI_00305 [Gemmatimonadota bacterium]
MKRTAGNALWVLPLVVLTACPDADSKQVPPRLQDVRVPLAPDTTALVIGGIARVPGTVPDTHRVVIAVDPRTGIFEYGDPATRESRTTVYANPGDVIVWTSEQGPWAVHHGPLTPFRVLRIAGRPGEWAGAQVRRDATFGKYRYFVAVEINGRIWMDDPDSMVGPER